LCRVNHTPVIHKRTYLLDIKDALILVALMRKNNAISQFIRTASLLVILFAIAFSLPSSAHANMVMQSVSQHEHSNDMGAAHVKMKHDNQVMPCGMTHKNSDGGHDGMQCCIGICSDVVAATISASFIVDEVHEHVALPYLAMASAETSHLIRPPNL
jgi:hypothetical protein